MEKTPVRSDAYFSDWKPTLILCICEINLKQVKLSLVLLTAEELDIKFGGIVLPLNDPNSFCLDDPS